MHPDTLERIIAKWPQDSVLNIYHANGFNTIVDSPNRIEITKHAVHGSDVTGLVFALPLSQIVYAILRANKKAGRNK